MKLKSVVLGLGLLAVSVPAHAIPRGIYYVNRPFIWTAPNGAKVRVPARPPASTLAGTKLEYFGGPVLSNVKVYSVMWGPNVDPTVQQNIGGFFKTVTNSTYFDWLKEYDTNVRSVDGRTGTNQGIGRGAFAGQFTITPKNTSQSLQDADIQAELDSQVAAGHLPTPDNNSFYMTYFPPGVSITIDGQSSCQAFCGYHESFMSTRHAGIFYGVIPDLGGACSFGCGSGNTKFDNTTMVTSHELIEGTTDPDPTAANQPGFPTAWNTTDGSEIGDLCVGESTTVSSANSTYYVQQEYDNGALACAPGPYRSP